MDPDHARLAAISWVSQYTASFLPRDHPRVNQFAVRVQSAGRLNEWMVITGDAPEVWRSRVKSEISWRIRPDDTEWRSRYVFTLPKALALAWEVAAVRTVNGRTALDVLAEGGDSTDEHVPDDHGTVGPKHLDEARSDDQGTVAAGSPYAGRHRPAPDSGLQAGGSCRGYCRGY